VPPTKPNYDFLFFIFIKNVNSENAEYHSSLYH